MRIWFTGSLYHLQSNHFGCTVPIIKYCKQSVYTLQVVFIIKLEIIYHIYTHIHIIMCIPGIHIQQIQRSNWNAGSYYNEFIPPTCINPCYHNSWIIWWWSNVDFQCWFFRSFNIASLYILITRNSDPTFVTGREF